VLLEIMETCGHSIHGFINGRPARLAHHADESDGDLDKEERRLCKRQTPQWPAVDTGVVYVQFASDEALTRALEALCCNGRACLVRNTARSVGHYEKLSSELC
jgi:hypothetical protein